MGGGFCRGVEKYECVLVPVAHSRTPGAPSSDDGLDPRLLPLPLLMAPLSLMLLPRLNLKPDDIEGCHYCIDLWNGCFDCDVDARLFYHSCVCWGSRPSGLLWLGSAGHQSKLVSAATTNNPSNASPINLPFKPLLASLNTHPALLTTQVIYPAKYLLLNISLT